VRKTT